MAQRSLRVSSPVLISRTFVVPPSQRGGVAKRKRVTETAAPATSAAKKKGGLEAVLKPFRRAAIDLMSNYKAWGLTGTTPPVTIDVFEGATDIEQVRRAIEQKHVRQDLQTVNAELYGGIPQNLAGLWRATTLYLKYELLEFRHLPLAEAAKVKKFETAVEKALVDINPKRMVAISTLFNDTDDHISTEWMSLAVETQEGKWFSVNGPHHHPWGGHIHDVWTPPESVR